MESDRQSDSLWGIQCLRLFDATYNKLKWRSELLTERYTLIVVQEMLTSARIVTNRFTVDSDDGIQEVLDVYRNGCTFSFLQSTLL